VTGRAPEASAPAPARGLDQYLAELTRHPVGRGVVWLVAAGFLTFAGYTLIEIRYRAVDAGDYGEGWPFQHARRGERRHTGQNSGRALEARG
jgi:hypothetical protein